MSKVKSKTFRIGEYAIGGIISVKVYKDVIQVEALDWISKEPILSDRFHMEISPLPAIEGFLFQITTSYYTDKIMEFIKTKMI